MKAVAYVPLHYGKEFLRYALQAVEPAVDRVVVLYTPIPSFGHVSFGTTCPDSEEELRACCDFLGDRLTWFRGRWGNERSHRAEIECMSAGASVVVAVDADEVWDTDALSRCIKEAYDGTGCRYLTGGFVHFWRSFGWACRDGFGPVRFLKPGGDGDRRIEGKVYHFSLAQTEKLVRYKWTCHGHQDELRPDWLDEIFGANRRTDCHPVVLKLWNAEPFDRTKLPELLKSHPYYDRELIQ